jgi:hypothetical protein
MAHLSRQQIWTPCPRDRKQSKGNKYHLLHLQRQAPKDRIKDVTYGSYSYEIKQKKEEKHRMRLTARGDRINYPDNVGTPTSDMTLVKVLLNRILSSENT